jgi:hypothetical protein
VAAATCVFSLEQVLFTVLSEAKRRHRRATVDTMTAPPLLKTSWPAARRIGVEFTIICEATLASAFALAISQLA